jgi:hypothetical protein
MGSILILVLNGMRHCPCKLCNEYCEAIVAVNDKMRLTKLFQLEHQIIKKQDQTRLVNQLQAEMSRIFNHTDMANLLAEYLPKIGFASCFMV